jgi:NAD(P)-dependent dehydrogenase (short-subunit alcohol dehydrogenase family)
MEDVRRVCLLTGASGPLGTAFVERYADRYDIVAVHHRRPVYTAAQSQELIDPLAPDRQLANARRAHTIRADISRQEQVDALVAETLAEFQKIDVLVNAASVRQCSSLLADGVGAGAGDVFSVNVLAPLWLSLSIARTSWREDLTANIELNRNIINVSSTAGLFVYPDSGQAIYAASKAALNHLTYHLANELWDIGIRANAVAPDPFPGRVPIDDVLDAIAELDASSETGQVRALQGSDQARAAATR